MNLYLFFSVSLKQEVEVLNKKCNYPNSNYVILIKISNDSEFFVYSYRTTYTRNWYLSTFIIYLNVNLTKVYDCNKISNYISVENIPPTPKKRVRNDDGIYKFQYS